MTAKNRIFVSKRVLSVLVLPIASFILTASGASLVASAIEDPSTRKYINADSWVDFYDTLQGHYLKRDGTYENCTFRFVRWTDAQGDFYYPNQTFNISTSGGKWAIYGGDIPYSNVYDDFQIIKVYLDTQIHLHKCSYAEFGSIGYMYPDFVTFANLNINAVNHYNYFNFFSPSLGESTQIKIAGNQAMDKPCQISADYNLRWSGAYGSILFPIETDVIINELTFSCVQNQSGDPIYFALQLPYVSGDTQLFEPYIPPESGVGGVVSGSGSGIVTTDISGVTGFAWDVTLEMPEYMYSGTYSEYSDNFPATISSIASGMEEYGTTAASALYGLAEDADVGGLWGCITSFLPPGVIVLIMGLSGIYLVGWVLTRFSA